MSDQIPSVEELEEIAATRRPSMHATEWTLQAGLDVIRENRRRYAATNQETGVDEWCAQLAAEIVTYTGVDPTTAATVLLFAASRAGAAISDDALPGATFLLNALSITADEITRHAPEAQGGGA